MSSSSAVEMKEDSSGSTAPALLAGSERDIGDSITSVVNSDGWPLNPIVGNVLFRVHPRILSGNFKRSEATDCSKLVVKFGALKWKFSPRGQLANRRAPTWTYRNTHASCIPQESTMTVLHRGFIIQNVTADKFAGGKFSYDTRLSLLSALVLDMDRWWVSRLVHPNTGEVTDVVHVVGADGVVVMPTGTRLIHQIARMREYAMNHANGRQVSEAFSLAATKDRDIRMVSTVLKLRRQRAYPADGDKDKDYFTECTVPLFGDQELASRPNLVPSSPYRRMFDALRSVTSHRGVRVVTSSKLKYVPPKVEQPYFVFSLPRGCDLEFVGRSASGIEEIIAARAARSSSITAVPNDDELPDCITCPLQDTPPYAVILARANKAANTPRAGSLKADMFKVPVNERQNFRRDRKNRQRRESRARKKAALQLSGVKKKKKRKRGQDE